MEYVTLGKTGRRVSRLGYGGAPAGLRDYIRPYDPASGQDRQGVLAALERAVALGITYFDTAPGYGAGLSEVLFGEALAPHAGKLFIATKYGLRQGEGVRASLEASLGRLRLDAVDLLQLHGSSWSDEQAERILEPGGPLDQMEALRQEGLVRHLGFTSEDNNPALYRFIQDGRFDVMQVCYNFLSQHPYEPTRPFGSLLAAREEGMGVAAMRVTTSGRFQKWVQQVNPANTFDYTPALIQFVLSNPLVHVALVGMRTPQRVEQNVAFVEDEGGRIDLDQLLAWYV